MDPLIQGKKGIHITVSRNSSDACSLIGDKNHSIMKAFNRYEPQSRVYQIEHMNTEEQ